MSATAAARPAVSMPSRGRPLPAILVGGLITGLLDMTYAMLVYSPKNPLRIPQAVATGVFGRESFNLGARSIVLGFVFHFSIALGAATVYYLASRKLTVLVRHAVPCGMIFGALVYLFMHFVVIPLSLVPSGNTPMIYKVTEFVWHWFGVGLPISLSVRHYSR
ncbi:MAG TPA: hypothetical protein VF376_10505 [Thermoanaerobaculia bacterium]